MNMLILNICRKRCAKSMMIVEGSESEMETDEGKHESFSDSNVDMNIV